ncbi:unnamed protein product [Paramecium primaurelia]|uniref:WD40-repeat-containing domain n=1 Tax=Paramecium primaurelia TaxID=5886 RepID=A0A8S1NLI7_PARPR|nr:unnamed protein product [Paramecium primaurelia]
MQQNEPQQPQKPFKYSIICQNPIPQRNRWQICMAINGSNSIFLFSEELTIRVFQFNNKMGLKHIQLLNNNRTSALSFFPKQQDQFVTGSKYSSILIWSKQLISKAKFIQKLSGHIKGVSCIIFNVQNTLIISGGEDSQIKFWTPYKSNQEEQIRNISDLQWHCQQTIKDFNTTIATLSINEQGNKLISCSTNQNIMVIQKSSTTQMWVVIQKIKTEMWGRQLQFLNDKNFVFLPYDGKQLYLYRLNSVNNYTRKANFLVSLGYQYYGINPFYFQDRNILILQGTLFLSCFRIKGNKKQSFKKKENFEIEKELQIDFQPGFLKAILSLDGQYLITLHQNQSEIQVRQFQEI